MGGKDKEVIHQEAGSQEEAEDPGRVLRLCILNRKKGQHRGEGEQQE